MLLAVDCELSTVSSFGYRAGMTEAKGIWVGVDPGEKRIGVARSDPLWMLAHPAVVVGSPRELIALVREWLGDRDVAGVVVGLPLNMDGSIGPMARRSFELVRELRAALEIPVHLWDERLSTRHVETAQVGKRSGEVLDHKAAAGLLQTYLDAGAPGVNDPPEYEAKE